MDNMNLKRNVAPYEICRFNVPGLELVGKRWGAHQYSRKVIGLHGWLDNCASLDGLATRLKADIVCLDLAGHGRSSARQHLGAYNVWLDIAEVLSVADQLGWQSFDLLGHSRGAAIAFLIAGTYPQRVENLVCLDGLCPLIADENKAPEQLHQSISAVKKLLSRQQNFYSSIEGAISARECGMFPLCSADAKCLADWGVAEVSEGFYWQYDPKASAPSELKFTINQIAAFAHNIQAKVSLHLASKGIILNNPDAMMLINSMKAWHRKEYQASHHFHMSECVDILAGNIYALWESKDES